MINFKDKISAFLYSLNIKKKITSFIEQNPIYDN